MYITSEGVVFMSVEIMGKKLLSVKQIKVVCSIIFSDVDDHLHVLIEF